MVRLNKNILTAKTICFVICLIIISCEPRSDYNYFVVNNSNEAIRVSYVVCIYPDKESIVEIEPQSKYLIFEEATTDSNVGIDGFLQGSFLRISITQGNRTSKLII